MAAKRKNAASLQIAEEPPSSCDAGEKENKVYLRRQINIIDGIALTLGVIIGSGIFISPSGILRFSGSIGWSLIIWVFCGVLSTLGALSFAELSTTFQVSGGAYSYLLEAFWPVTAFVKIYCDLVVTTTAGDAIMSISFTYYLLLPFYPDCEIPYAVTKLIAACVICLITCLNCYSVPISTKVQIIFTVAKVVGLAVIIGFGIAALAEGRTDNLQNAFARTPTYRTFPLAVYSGLFAYAGWQNLMIITEEVVRPSRTIPVAVIMSLAGVTVIYVLVNIAYFLTLTEEEILTSNAIALDLGRKVLGEYWWFFSVVVALSIAGSMNGMAMARARLFLVASREGQMPEIGSMIHVDRKTPLPAAVFTIPVSLMMLISDDIFTLINYLSISTWIFSGLVVAIIPIYRYKYPDLPRPFKVPLIIPIVYTLCCFFVVGMSLYSSPVDCGIGVGIALTGIPVYCVCVWWQGKPSWFNTSLDKLTIFLQQLMYVVPQEEDEETEEQTTLRKKPPTRARSANKNIHDTHTSQ